MTAANISIHLWAECPQCREDLDLFDCDQCPETAAHDSGIVAWDMVKRWLNNTKQLGETIKCGECGHSFIIDRLEW